MTLFTRITICIVALLLGSAACENSSHSADATDTTPTPTVATTLDYPVVDTGQSDCYDNSNVITCPQPGAEFYGQDPQRSHHPPSYTDNGDGTVTDNQTGLVWQKTPGSKVNFDAAKNDAATLQLGGENDWRLPTIKELYSLMNFSGYTGMEASNSKPYIDTSVFDFSYGDTTAGERMIDAQFWSATEYVSTTMNGDATVFGVNFADGRIKGYPKFSPQSGGDNKMFVRYVRGNPKYGQNDFVDNGDQTISDRATGLMWLKQDSGVLAPSLGENGKLSWKAALAWCETLEYAGHSDWRLPHAKELQSIVDYTRSPDTTDSAAIDARFSVSTIAIGDLTAHGYFWSSTTHSEGIPATGDYAVYICFGECLGYMAPPNSTDYLLLDVHGAGAQRSDPKTGDPASFPHGFGPQGDDIRVVNFARCVRSL